MSDRDQDHCLFIVRVWSEPRPADNTSQWRGSVEQLPGGGRFYFAAVADLADFFALRLQPSSLEPPPSVDGPVSRSSER